MTRKVQDEKGVNIYILHDLLSTSAIYSEHCKLPEERVLGICTLSAKKAHALIGPEECVVYCVDEELVS